jgi:hypothetical protein
MAYPVIASFASAYSATTTSTTVVVNKPTGTAEGDLLLALMGTDGAPVTLAAPEGWYKFQQDAAGVSASGAFFTKQAGAAEPSTYTFTSTDAESLHVGILRITGASRSGIVIGVAVHSGNATTTTAPTITTVADESLVIRYAFIDNTATPSLPASHTDIYSGTGAASSVSVRAAYQQKATVGATGTADFTHASEQGGAYSIAVAPAGTAPLQPVMVTAAGALVELRSPATLVVTATGALVEIVPAGGPRKVGGNVTVILDGVDITTYIDNARLEGIVNTFQSTVFSSSAETFIPTTSRWAFPLGGAMSMESDWVLFPIASRGREVSLRISFGTSVLTWAAALLVDYRVTSRSPREKILWIAALAGQSAPEMS